MLKEIQKYYGILNKTNFKIIFQSKDNCHAKGLFSLVIGGTENGKLTRVFIASEEIRPFDIALHTHRYDLTITTLTNGIRHHIAQPGTYGSDVINLAEYEYQSPLNDGNGLKAKGIQALKVADYDMPSLTHLYMVSNQIHTISCKAGAVWIVEEHGFIDQKHSFVYGEPFVVDGLYTSPKLEQLYEKINLVSNLLEEKIIKLDQPKETKTS